MHKFNPKSLKYVILGLRSAKEMLKTNTVVSRFNHRNGTDVKILYATMSSDQYSMEINSNPVKRFSIQCPEIKQVDPFDFWED